MAFHIETQEIRAFKAVVEENGFQRAADKLFVTQSAVSQTIANLEKKVDTVLLERNPLKLTEAGARMLNYAEMVLAEESDVLSDIRNINQGIHSTLMLAVNSTVNYLYGDALFYQYCSDGPLTKLKLNVLPSRQIYSAIASDAWELGFGPFQQRMPEHLTALPLFADQRELVISTAHFTELSKKPELLTDIPLIVSHLDAPDLRPTIEKLRDSFGTIWEVNDLSQRINLVAQGVRDDLPGSANPKNQ
jgi:DNA-binding transcriptional LysR family regulator